MFLHPTRPRSASNKGSFFRWHLHESCDIHDHNEGSESFGNKRLGYFVRPLGSPMGMELGSCHLSDTNSFEKATIFFFFLTWANTSCILRAYLHCKTDDTVSEAVLHRRLQVSFMVT